MSSSTDRLVAGRIGKPHGLLGEATVVPDTDDPERFAPGSSFTTDAGRELVVSHVKPYRDRGLLVRFEGVRGREQAEQLRGALLLVEKGERRQLVDDEFWPEDLVGLEAHDPAGRLLGIVDRIDFGVGQDRIVVRRSDGVDVLVPFVSDIVGDPEDGIIVVDAPEGLFS